MTSHNQFILHSLLVLHTQPMVISIAVSVLSLMGIVAEASIWPPYNISIHSSEICTFRLQHKILCKQNKNRSVS